MAYLMLRRTAGLLSTLLVTAAAVIGLSAPAQAEDGYQYWHYFHLQDGAWAFAETGPADATPEDGAVEGFRFGTSTTSQPIEPRADLEQVSFDSVCAGSDAEAGEKRVAVVLDYGTEEDAGTAPEPRAECAVVDQGASTQQVIGEVAEVRVEDGLTCAFDGYPASGCGVPVADAQVPTDEETVAFAVAAEEEPAAADDAADEESSGLLWPLVGVGLVVLLIAAGALALSRRNKVA